MPRPIWKGSISFGLVNIPVALYSAEKKEELAFTLLDRRDNSPVRYKRVNENTGAEVAWEDIVKGYEYEPGKRVVLTEADLKEANPEAASKVEIVDFVDAAEVDPIYFEKPYYLGPSGKLGDKGYVLLRETLERSGKMAIGKVVIRTKQRLCAVTPEGPLLQLTTMRFADEVRDPAGIGAPNKTPKELGISPKEIEMAERLVEGMSEPFRPERYKDDYRGDVMALIQARIADGQALRTKGEPDNTAPGKRGKVIDLMPLLMKSLEAAREKGKPARKAGPKAKAKSAPKGSRPRGS
ncbi:MAG TPA: Ku protein [Armatimonadota bacterium]|jgi:DNA end-binding protein Ku